MTKERISKLLLVSVLILGLILVGCSNQYKGIEEDSTTSQPPPLPSAQQSDKQIPYGNDAIDLSKSQELSVAIQGSKFSPQTLKIKSGTKVTWTNMDSAPHNVKSSDGTLDSPDLFKGDSWSFTFTTKGTYNYICDIHPSMKGSVIVE